MTDRRARRRLALALWALGLLGTASLLAAPLEVVQPPGLDIPPLAFRALALINPVVLMSVAVIIGAFLAPKVGLDAPVVRAAIERGSPGRALRRQVVPAVVVAAVTAVVLLAYGAMSEPWFADADVPDVTMPLVSKLLYGGIVEELMTRWGFMSLLAWAGWRLAGRPDHPPAAIFIGAALLAAILFAVAHLPMLFTIMPSPAPGMIVAVIAGNMVPGFLFGMLFWQRGLEAAMIAHAGGHLIYTVVSAL